MPDRSKVIKGLECHVNLAECPDCPYIDATHPGWGCHLEELIADALVLLREQEPVEPRKVKRYIEYSDTDINSPDTYDCGNCGEELPDNAKYCPECGRAVKYCGERDEIELRHQSRGD